MAIDFKNVRKELVTRLNIHVKREAALERHLRGQDGRLDEDFSDRVSYTQMDEVLEQLDDASRAQILAITTAMGRLDNGTYGTCVGCGVDITPGRLEALPETAICVSCAS